MKGRYEIHERIGQGGLGAVYRATDKQLNREVAIKRLLPIENQDKMYGGSSQNKLINEARTLSSLQHPNIVTVYDVGVDDEGAFVVMELIKGEAFDLTVERGALTKDDFNLFVAQTMEALLVAHDKGIIHRDLKPSNLMVSWLPTGKFQIKILDFGLAKLGKKPTVQTTDQGDGILGSIYFMAPEQFERAELDQRTDLYALGAIYYYALTSKYPFDGDTGPLVMAAHLNGTVRNIAEIREDLPHWLTDWVMNLISRKPDDRPKDSRDAYDSFCRNIKPDVSTKENNDNLSQPRINFSLPNKNKSISSFSNAELTQNDNFLKDVQESIEATNDQSKRPPLWLLISIPILIVIIVSFVLVKTGEKKVIEERNSLIQSLNEAEEPKGNSLTVKEFMTFMKSQSDTEIGRNNITASITTLARLGGEGVDKEIFNQLSNLGSGYPIIRAGLIGVMIDKSYWEGLPAIIPLLDDKNNQVVDAAVYAVGELGKLDDVDFLLTNLESSSNDKANALENAIVRICLRSPDLEIRNAEVRRVLVQEAPDGMYRLRILRILGFLGGEKAWSDLKRILNGKDSDAKKAVLQTIGSWPNGKPLKTLFEIIDTEKDEVLKRMAFRSYVLLLSAPSDLSDETKAKEIMDIFKLNFGRNDQIDLIGALANLATENALKFADQLGDENERFKNSADLASKQITLNLSKRIEYIGGEEEYSAKSGLIFGESLFNYDSSQEALMGWTNPQYYITWPINFSDPGEYELILDIEKPKGGGGEFEVVLGPNRETLKVPEGDGFQKVIIGNFSLENSGTYRIIVTGLNLEQNEGELMRLRSLKLKKSK